MVEYITVDVIFRLLGGAQSEMKFRIECGTRTRSEVMRLEETIREWRERVKASLAPREQAHALCVSIGDALIDEEDEIAGWSWGDAVAELRGTEAIDNTWIDDPEEEQTRPSWSPMTQAEIDLRLTSLKQHGTCSDDEDVKKTQPYRPPGPQLRTRRSTG
jgi:hypothetical protein